MEVLAVLLELLANKISPEVFYFLLTWCGKEFEINFRVVFRLCRDGCLCLSGWQIRLARKFLFFINQVRQRV